MASANENRVFRFSCSLCQTRLAARVKDSGRRAKCPKCGALTAVPEPPPVPAQTQSARSGHSQSEMWGVDEAPLPAEQARSEPKYHPFYCRNCDSLLHATDAQIGSLIRCHDCGAQTVAPTPAPDRSTASVLVPDGEEYQLDESSDPGPRPAPRTAVFDEPETTDGPRT